jgi:hypothetical protein
VCIHSDASQWSDLFPQGFILEIIELVTTTWGIFKKPNRREREERITRGFAERVRQEKNRRDDLPFKIRVEVSIPDVENGQETGRVDFIFDYVGTIREEVYFAFECKRLRIPYESGLDTNNSEYTNEQGMMCFITGKYSGSVTNGGMIGYVMDGQIKKAINSVGRLIKNKELALKLAKGTGLERSSVMGNSQNVRETRHILNETKFTIHHIFLAV